MCIRDRLDTATEVPDVRMRKTDGLRPPGSDDGTTRVGDLDGLFTTIRRRIGRVHLCVHGAVAPSGDDHDHPALSYRPVSLKMIARLCRIRTSFGPSVCRTKPECASEVNGLAGALIVRCAVVNGPSGNRLSPSVVALMSKPIGIGSGSFTISLNSG